MRLNSDRKRLIHRRTIGATMPHHRMALRLDRLPAALRSVFACLRFSFDQDTGKLCDACRQIEDWDAFLWWAQRHRVLPMVYNNLRRTAWGILPDTVQASLEGEYRRNSFRSLALAGETVGLIRLLAQNGVAAIPLKGQVLALQVYDDLSIRHAGDIDLLIGPQNIDKADEVLQGQGYRLDNPHLVCTPLRKRFIRRRIHHHHYFSATNRIQVEIHWRMSAVFRLPFQFDRLWSQGEHFSFTGDALTVLPGVSNMIFLCIHGATHGWSRLKWLCDIAHIQSGYRQTDWIRLFTVARGLNAARPVVQACALAHIVFGSPMPDWVAAEAVKDKAISRLLKTAVCRLGAPDPRPRTVLEKCSFHLYRVGLRNTLRHKIEALSLTYNANDWRTVPLPDSLFVLYYPIRPLLWMKRQVQRKMAN
jgi:Uncharacterised nucleotidyltransferase